MNESSIIKSFFCNQMQRNGEKEAVWDYTTDTHYTYNDLQIRAYRLANFLRNELGIEKNDRIAILSRNDMVYIDTFYATIYTGTIVTAYSGYLITDTLVNLINNERPRVLFFEKEYEHIVEKIKPLIKTCNYIVLNGDSNPFGPHLYTQIMQRYNDTKPDFIKLNLEDIMIFMHTGGTTGIPKAAALSIRAQYLNVVGQQNTWNLTNHDSTIAYLPMFHTATWNTLVMPLLYAGGRIILLKKFEPKVLLDIIEREKVSMIWGIPTTYRRLMNEPKFQNTDFSSIVWCRCGAAPPSIDMMKQYWNKNITFCNGYGMTETSPGVFSMPASTMTLDEIKSKRLSCGKLMPYTDAKIVDEKGKRVPIGQQGELLLSGSLLFSEYWNNPYETKKAIVNGWFHTGDIACVDEDGFYYIIGRKNNIFISNGENIYPSVIENEILSNPEIEDTCVIGVPDEKRGSVGKAIVVLNKGSKLTEEELRSFLKGKLASIQIPAYIQFVKYIPKNSVGKVDLQVIKALYGQNEQI